MEVILFNQLEKIAVEQDRLLGELRDLVINNGAAAEKKPPRSAALLIGLNYTNQELCGPGVPELRGCVNDVHRMRDFLQGRLGFAQEDVVVLTDAPPQDGGVPPTADGILQRIDEFVARATERGCSRLWFHFSGHGSFQIDYSGDERDGRDECLIASDGHAVSDDDLLSRLVLRAPVDAHLTCVMDCCHSGTQLDLKYRYIGGQRSAFINQKFPVEEGKVCNVVCLSGCRDRGTSADALLEKGWAGAMSSMLLCVLDEEGPNATCQDLLRKIRTILREQSFEQVPQITSTFVINHESRFCC